MLDRNVFAFLWFWIAFLTRWRHSKCRRDLNKFHDISNVNTGSWHEIPPSYTTMEIFIMQIISASICPGARIGSASSLLVLNHKEHRSSRKLDGQVGQVDVSNFCLFYFAFIIFTFISLFLFSWISIKISLKFVPKGPINYIPSLIQIMPWRRPGDKPLSEPVMVRWLIHIWVSRPEWLMTQKESHDETQSHGNTFHITGHRWYPCERTSNAKLSRCHCC